MTARKNELHITMAFANVTQLMLFYSITILCMLHKSCARTQGSATYGCRVHIQGAPIKTIP